MSCLEYNDEVTFTLKLLMNFPNIPIPNLIEISYVVPEMNMRMYNQTTPLCNLQLLQPEYPCSVMVPNFLITRFDQ